MANAYQPFTFGPGALVSNRTLSNIGVENYSVKRNMRRKDDVEARREGVDFFMPNGLGDLDYAYMEARPGAERLYAGTGLPFGAWGADALLHRSVRENGQEAIIAGLGGTGTSGGRVYRYIGGDDNDYWSADYTDTNDYVINSFGRTTWAGQRIAITDSLDVKVNNIGNEGMNIDSYTYVGGLLTVNVTMQEGYRYVLEWYDATDNNEYDGIDEVWTEVDWYWKDTGDPTVALTTSITVPAGKAYLFRVRETEMSPAPWRPIYSPFPSYGKDDRWQAVNVNGYTVINNGKTLPLVYRVEWGRAYPLYQLRDQGIARVGGIASVSGMLVCYDVSEIPPDQLDAWMDGDDPYGNYTGDVQRNRKSVIWSGIDNPFDFGMLFDVESRVSPGVLKLRLPTSSIEHGDSLTLYGASDTGGNLEARVTAVIDNQTFQLDKDFTYVEGLTLQHTNTIGSTTGSATVTSDLGAILRIAPISNGAVIYMERGIVFSEYTGNAADPFTFLDLRIPHDHSLRYPNSLVQIDDYTHVYAGINRFYSFNYQSRRPQMIAALEECDRIVFDVLHATSGKVANTGQPAAQDDYYKIYGGHNVMTSEVWWSFDLLTNQPDVILAYDYITKTASTLDLSPVGPMESVKDPVTGADMFILEYNGFVCNYGLSHTPRPEWDNATEMYKRRENAAVTGPISTDVSYSDYNSVLESGLGSFNDRFNAKDTRGILLDTSSRTGSVSVNVELGYRRYEGANRTSIGTGAVNATAGPALYPVYARGHYFDHAITVTGGDDWQLASITYEIKGVRTRSNLRS